MTFSTFRATILAGACLFSTVGCTTLGLVAPTSVAAIETDATSARADLAAALNAYPVIKAVADAAAIVDPGLAPIVSEIEAIADPVASSASAALADVTTDVATLTSLVNTLKSQVAALQAAIPASK